MATLDKINALADERQRLWRLAAKHKLTPLQWERCFKVIPNRLADLWHDRRKELKGQSKPRRRSIQIVERDVLDDYLDRAQTTYWSADDMHGMHIESAPDLPMPTGESASDNPLDQYGVEVLREVFGDLKRLKLERKRRHLRNWLHNHATLREIRARYGENA